MRKDEAIELFRYTDWANQRVAQALLSLDAEMWERDIGGSFGTIRATASHLISADWIWLERWKGHSPDGRPAWVERETLPDLFDRMRRLGAERIELVEALPEDALEKVLEYRSLGGDPHRRPLHVLFRHVANHSTYHRGQLVMMLRMAGGAAPGTDFVYWNPES